MSLYRLLLRPTTTAAKLRPLLRSVHNNTFTSPPTTTNTSPETPNPSNDPFPFASLSSLPPPPPRTYGFSSAEEAAAERRRRKRRLRIEPPLHAIQRNPYPPPRDPNAPPLPDSTSALTGPRLNLHNRVQSLIRAFDLDAASHLARAAVYSRTRPTVFTCNAIIAAMYRAGRYDEAKALFKYFFEQHNIVPNVVSYNNLINTLCDEGKVDEGMEVYRRIIANAPFAPSSVTYRHLTKGFVDTGRIGDAVDLLREMLNKGNGADSLVYNNVIKGYLELGNLERANEFFNELKERCLVYDGSVNATFMEWWFKQGKDKEAMDSYKSLLEKKFRMVPATCNVLLATLVKYGKKEAAQALFEQMLDDHTPPTFQGVNSETFNIMVNECFKEGKFAEAIATFRKAGTKERSKPFAMDVAGYNNLISRFCEHGMLTEAENFFIELCAKSLSPDVTSYKTLIEAFLKMERFDDAFRIFSRMVDAGLRVVASFGIKVFRELIENGKALESGQILLKMGEKDPKPDPSVYDVVVRGLCNVGELDTSRDIMQQMMGYGVGVPPPLKEFAREAFQNAGRGEQIEEILDEKRWRSPLRVPRQPLREPGSAQFMRPSPLGPSAVSGNLPSSQPGVLGQQPSWLQSGQRPPGSFQLGGQPSLGPSSVSGNPMTSQHEIGSQQQFGRHGVTGQISSWSPPIPEQQPFESCDISKHQVPSSYQARGQQMPSLSQVGGEQPSFSSRGSGKQPSWSSHVGGQQPSWFQAGEQPTWSSQLGQQPHGTADVGGKQLSSHPEVASQQPFGHQEVATHVPLALSLASGNQLSESHNISRHQPSWPSHVGGQQIPETFPVGGQQSPSYSQVGGQRVALSSQMGGQLSGSLQVGEQSSGHFSGGFSRSAGQCSYISGSMSRNQPSAGQPQWQDQWQDNRQEFDVNARQQPNGTSSVGGQQSSGVLEWQRAASR